jgi:hypothetical protein
MTLPLDCIPAPLAQPAAESLPVPQTGGNQFPDDPVLPQLRTACDPEAMAGIFRGLLREPAGRTFEITDCRLSRASYLRGDRCVFRYTVRLADVQGGSECDQWIVGAIDAGDKASRTLRKLNAKWAGRDVPHFAQPFEPFSYLPALNMLVQVFPFDRGLPTLPLLVEGPPPAMEKVLLESLGAGAWYAEAWTVEQLEISPGTAAVLRYTVRACSAVLAETVERRFYVKVYGDEPHGAGAYELLRALSGAADAEANGFSFCRPVAYFKDHAALVLEEVPGSSLRQAILRGPGMEWAVRQTARAMAAWHLGEAPTESRPLEGEISRIVDMGARIEMACPHLGPAIEEVVNAVAAGLPEIPPRPTHGNMKLDHVFLDGGRVVFIDLDSFAASDPVLDAAALLAQLAAMASSSAVARRRTRMAARVFAEEYFGHVPREWHSRLPVHYAGALLVTAYGLFRSQTPGWPATIARLVEEARQSVAGRIW